MKQYRVTYKVDVDGSDDCVLSPDDPLNKIKEEQFLGKLANFEVEEAETDESVRVFNRSRKA